MAKKNSGLGRGLDAIFLDNFIEEEEKQAFFEERVIVLNTLLKECKALL